MPLNTTQHTGNEPSVIVFGGDHHNTLGVIRALGKSGVPFSVLIHDTRAGNPLICCRYSRYIQKNLAVVSNNETEILQYFQKHSLDGQKIPVITTSDFAAYVIDNNYESLSVHYHLPSVQNTGGNICKYMDKFEQKKLAEQYDIPMAKTWVVHPNDNLVSSKSDVIFPCICKPVVSAEGSKSDIRVANTLDEYVSLMQLFAEKEYDVILVQEFLDIEYEILVAGCRTKNSKESISHAFKKIRRYPVKGGSTSYGVSIVDSNELEKIDNIVSILDKMDYNGFFDIEIFRVENHYLLNEINFRNSGSACVLTQNNVNLPLIWARDAMGFDTSNLNKSVNRTIYLMNFISEVMLILRESESFTSLLKSYKDVNTFVKFDLHDLPGSLVWIIPLCLGVLRKLFL